MCLGTACEIADVMVINEWILNDPAFVRRGWFKTMVSFPGKVTSGLMPGRT